MTPTIAELNAEADKLLALDKHYGRSSNKLRGQMAALIRQLLRTVNEQAALLREVAPDAERYRFYRALPENRREWLAIGAEPRFFDMNVDVAMSIAANKEGRP